MTQLRRERGQKIFECFLGTCPARFQTPKGRRLHLIEKHAYPPQYFFAVTVWGIEEVLKKGGGMVRRDWTPRPDQSRSGASSSRRGDSEESFGSQPSPASERLASPLLPDVDHGSSDPSRTDPEPVPERSASADVDALTSALSGTSISLVPRSVRLARKTKMPIDPTST
ncbi:hypothetical protein B0A53_05502 [Rhodotorula sp. CCFEE 5036]|nr:hypothetical protein B0A53_05502 [Rhodotorula sp. CCFEE 5036]